MKLIFVTIFLILQNCILHSVSIEDKRGVTSKEINDSKLQKPIPIYFYFGKSKESNDKIFYRSVNNYKDYKNFKDIWTNTHGINCSSKSEIKVKFIEKYNKEFPSFFCELGDELRRNHFSEEYNSKFQKSKFLTRNANSNLTIELNSYPDLDLIEPGYITALLSMTFGIFPQKLWNQAKVDFSIYNREKNKSIKIYTYKIEHRIYRGIFIPLVGVILPIFSERYDHSQNLNTFAIARVVFNEFEEDFIRDFSNDENLQKAAYLHDPPIYKIQKPSESEISKSPYIAYFLSKLESELIQRNIKLVKDERGSIDFQRIIQIQDLKIDEAELNYQINILDAKDPKLNWTRNIKYNNKEIIPNEKKIESSIRNLIDVFQSEGIIN
ncbi:MAG: hypothetical protein KDK36_15090 [Leptospiraceae bacterium]|nr:hypothetical protein [Leptospiraceae bacterium]